MRDRPLTEAPLHTALLRFLFFAVVVRAVILVALGLTVRHRERLPKKGPAVLAANHNSHLDTLALMSLLPLRLLPKVRPVAAADYFLTSQGRGWFAHEHHRHHSGRSAAARKRAAIRLRRARTRSTAARSSSSSRKDRAASRRRSQAFKKGIGHLAKARPKVPVIPVFMHGLGKALPKGSALLVPFNCTVSVGEPLYGKESHDSFVKDLEASMAALAAEEKLPVWA